MTTMPKCSATFLLALGLGLLVSTSTTQAFTASTGRPAFTSSSSSRVLSPRQSQPQLSDGRCAVSRGQVLYMGWGPDPVWSAATVSTNEKACESGMSVSVTLAVPAETAAAYANGGQYVQVRLNEETKPQFLAICSAPNPETASFEFLIKKVPGNEWMTSIAAGATVEVSQVLGPGFNTKDNLDGLTYDFPTQNVLLFAAGSGLAPIKAAMESGALGVEPEGARAAKLYYGERTAADLCFTDKFAAWEQQGFQVIPVLSNPDASWKGRTGYVQNALEEDGIAIPRNSGALLCGMKGMTESVKDLLHKAGVFEGRVIFNF
jgi:NAD(P)H-flavin reductase